MSLFSYACSLDDTTPEQKDANLRILDVIYRFGPSMHSVDKLGRTPLHMAARAGNETAVRFILTNCEDTSILSLRTIGGDTPLMCAAE